MQSIRGKYGNNPQEESELSSLGFSRLSLGQKPTCFRKPNRSRRKLFAFSKNALSPIGVQRTKSFGAGFRGRRGPCLATVLSFFCNLIIMLFH